MKYLMEMVIWFLTLLKCSYQSDFNIAIIGGGIGGTSCAYFLKEIFKDMVNLDIYEGNKVGGRLATVIMKDGNEYETGGSVIHQRNKYMSNFVSNLGLQKRKSVFKNERLGLHNGKDFDFIENDNYFVNLMNILWRYGYSIKRLQEFVNNMLDKFERIYELQTNGFSFDSTYDLLTAMDPSFVNYLNISVKDAYLKEEHFSESLITELVQASLRVNYGQNTNVHEFVGSVSMAGMDGSLWSVKGGNKRVVEKLLEKSKAHLIPEYVVQITRNNDSYTLLTNFKKKATYDYVVFAAPLAENQKVPITFSNMPLALNKVGKYHQTVSTLVVGEMKRTRFSTISDDLLPITIISNNENEFFNSISNVEGVNETGSLNVWKIFSQQPLSNNQIDYLFENVSDVKVVDWLAYPHYSVPTESQSFHIADRLYHINAIEWTASAMEMSCIGAKNVALLIKKHFYSKELNETTKRSHMEL
ncbi:prenylcysteine oxidase 1-like isoform X1 [Rhopalosiphum padi]|uniref:prenylcysteine oxidase 1-like isoform X1 n=1 Tax=Rhopalosiphum padi TaxID=40932 RepID=UPI00298EAC39|nr:prenylcysteine oxidase 1-like isoform X1 [Rhopalosiphum padi]XP_060835998.1 prenylcysteine oxidase 1-like isoform X1 [Rhopalosiphum padi]